MTEENETGETGESGEAGGVESVKTAFLVVLDEDGTAYATNTLREVIVDDEGTPVLIDPEDRATPAQMLAAVKTVEADIERALTIRKTVEAVVPNMLNAQMQAAQKMAQNQQDSQIAQQVMGGGQKLHVPGQ